MGEREITATFQSTLFTAHFPYKSLRGLPYILWAGPIQITAEDFPYGSLRGSPIQITVAGAGKGAGSNGSSA